MYLHFIDDVSQINHFINRTNDLFPGEHLFQVVSVEKQIEKINASEGIKLFQPTAKNIKKVASELKNFKAVFIHNLCYHKARIILKAPADTIFIWGVWGFDYYYVYPCFFGQIFLPYTKWLNFALLKLSLPYKSFFYTVYPVGKYLGFTSKCRIRQEAARRITYSFQNMPVHSDLNRVFKLPGEKRFRGLYYSVENFFPHTGLPLPEISGDNILIGNSATNSSNHLDIFAKLKGIDLKGRKLIVPLNYGCKRYAWSVNLVGRQMFKSAFYGLLKYYPLPEYSRLLLECNVMIFNHRRSQAFGNVLFGIWAGHKVFLRKQNPVYSFMRDLGIVVFAIDDELVSEKLESLPNEIRINNRRIIENSFNEKQIRKNYLELLDAIKM